MQELRPTGATRPPREFCTALQVNGATAGVCQERGEGLSPFSAEIKGSVLQDIVLESVTIQQRLLGFRKYCAVPYTAGDASCIFVCARVRACARERGAL